MAIRTRPYDSARYLDSDDAIAEYQTAALESGESRVVTHALGVAVRAKGMTQIARDTGLRREKLFNVLNAEGNPELTTLMPILKALGVRLTATPPAAE